MLAFLTRFFTWWNGQTFGTQVFTARHGELVGTDEFGNTYYRSKGGKVDPSIGVERRWVIYAGYADASQIPPGWHGWMHHRTDVPPSQEDYQPREWQLPHKPNQTGTPNAYRPRGSILAAAQRPAATGDYQAWSPE